MATTKVVDKEMVQLWDRYETLQKGAIERYDMFLSASGIKPKSDRVEKFAFDWALGAGMSEDDARFFAAFIQRRPPVQKK